MQIEQVLDEPLKKEFRVLIPFDLIMKKANAWIEVNSKHVKIDGFRPGKAPKPVIRAQLSDRAFNQVIRELMNQACSKLENEITFRKIGDSSLSIEKPFNEDDSEQPFEFKVAYNAHPEIDFTSLSDIHVTKLIIKFPESEMNERLAAIAKTRVFYRPHTEPNNLKKGDRYHFHLEAKHGKKAVNDADNRNFILSVGDEDVLSVFLEEKLKGSKVDDVIEFVHVFFPDFPDRRFKGKTVQFKIRVVNIEESYSLPEGEELAQALNYESLEKLKEAVSTSISSEYKQKARLYHKRHLLDALADKYGMNIPESLVEKEFQNIWGRLLQEMEKNPDEVQDKTEDEIKEECRVLAERRVRLGLIISEVARQHDIKIFTQDVQRAVVSEAKKAGPHFSEVIQLYSSNEFLLNQLRSSILEEKVVEFLLTKATIERLEVTPKEFKHKMTEILPGFDEDGVEEALEQISQNVLLFEGLSSDADSAIMVQTEIDEQTYDHYHDDVGCNHDHSKNALEPSNEIEKSTPPSLNEDKRTTSKNGHTKKNSSKKK